MSTAIESTCTCFRLRRAARQVSQVYDQALAPAGVSLNEYSILRRAGGGAKLLGELADALGMERTTLTRNLRPLIDAGWLEEARGEDARHRFISITAAGRKRLAKAKPLWERAQRELDARFGAEASARLREDLDRLDQALRDSTSATVRA